MESKKALKTVPVWNLKVVPSDSKAEKQHITAQRNFVTFKPQGVRGQVIRLPSCT